MSPFVEWEGTLGEFVSRSWLKILAILVAPTALAVAGCGGRVAASGASAVAGVIVQAATTHVETNGITRFSATLPNGDPAQVQWSVSGGDPAAGPGTISRNGVYTPPSYLTEDSATVNVTARLQSQDPESVLEPTSTARLTVTPGFLQPLTPGNLALGPGGSIAISGSITEVGGTGRIRFSLADGSTSKPLAEAASGTAGSLSAPHCTRGAVNGPNPAYTVCSVTYTAPSSLPPSGSVFVVGSVADSSTLSWTRVLLNSAGISSNPASHQAHLPAPVLLGSSSGNNSDYDSAGGQLSDCCGGTLGALVQDAGGNQYVLSNNHVLARSDQALPGETIIQPGLIDNGCTPFGVGPGTTPVATLTGYPALASSSTNVDAAIARVAPGTVDPRGSILELGSRQADGTLGSGQIGLSSSGGKGEPASLGMMVAKSGRTTGLTCAAVSAVDVDVVVDYFTDCAETSHALTKTFTNQIAISGTSFSDAGDSGAMVVDASNAEPVGLFFSGGTDGNGVEHAIASPIGDVMTALDTQVPGTNGPTSYSLVGGADHPVSCLSYDGTRNSAATLPPASTLSQTERERAVASLPLARALVNPRSGIARVGITVSKDHPGEAAFALFLDPAQSNAPAPPAVVGGIATVIVESNGAVADSSAPPKAASMAQVLAVKQRNVSALLKNYPALFGVGVGQSLDSPLDAALMLFADRRRMTGSLPATMEGQRVRLVLMDRLHVTRSYDTPAQSKGSCVPVPAPSWDDRTVRDLFEDRVPLPD